MIENPGQKIIQKAGTILLATESNRFERKDILFVVLIDSSVVVNTTSEKGLQRKTV